MNVFHQLYLRLTLIQGLCLALGLGAMFQIQSAPKHHSQAAVEDRQTRRPDQSWQAGEAFIPMLSTHLKATSLIFLATWGALAGMTGWLMMREQRRQLLEMLHRYDESDLPDLRLLSAGVDVDQSDFLDIQEDEEESMLVFDAVRRAPRLRLALGDDSEIVGRPL